MKRNQPPVSKTEIKTLRFAKVVEESGKPEVVTLWADPKKDKQFMGYVTSKRVVTLIQKPTGAKKDFGMVGFHPQPFAAFLVFPKPLKSSEGSHIIGIKYAMLTPASTERVFVPRIVPKPVPQAPVEKTFTGKIVRTLTDEITFEVSAINLNEARKKALAQSRGKPLPKNAELINVKIVEIRDGSVR